MEDENAKTKKTAFGLTGLRLVGNGLVEAGRYSLFVALILIGIWCVGRIFETFSLRTVFESNLVYWMALFIWVLLGIFVMGTAIQYARNMTLSDMRHGVIFSWAFFGLLLAATLYHTRGYCIASIGLLATITGLTESAKQAVFLLFKFYPAAPILPVNLIAAKVTLKTIGVDSLLPFAWSSSQLLGFFIWSLAYGTLLLKFQGNRFPKIVHLVSSLAGLSFLMTIKSLGALKEEQLIFLHAGAIIILFLQVLLTYSSLRNAGREMSAENEEIKPISLPLPPSALRVALFLLLIFPILADLQNQFMLASGNRQIVQELTVQQSMNKPEYVLRQTK
jgi:hypothetical protein